MTESLTLPGLSGPVQIDLDRWGVAHIRAENEADLFFAQGFNAARDRLWQIDLWRKRGLGLLAADFGPGYLAQDWASRLFLYRGDMDLEWAAYGPDAHAICDAFASGINAYVDLIEAEPDRLPPEFSVLGTRPSRWDASDVVRIRTHGWMRNAASEIVRANVLARADVDTDLLRIQLEPEVAPHAAPGLDLAAIPPNALDLYKLAIAPVLFTDARLSASIADAWHWTSVAPSGEVVRTASGESNNWAIHGSRTATGRPIMANDPHRLHTVPALRYLVHLTAPGLDAIGAVEPNFPGITIGHNGAVAFGLTLFLGPDQEDVYVYETDDQAGSYRYGGGWEQMRVIDEVFDVKGSAAQTLPLKFTRHGAIVYEHAPSRQAIGIRTVWSEPGTAPYAAGLRAMRARTVDEFQDAMRNWRVPAVNQVCADRDGAIAWITAGLSPIRRNWDGLLPVPGDGRYEWDGFLDAALLPAERNPSAGFVASANAMNLPAGWSHAERPMGYEWDDPSRARRIEEALRAVRGHSLRDSAELQLDVVSIPARRLCALLESLDGSDEDTTRALALLRDWDHRVLAESGAAALFEAWWAQQLKPALLERFVPDAALRTLIAPGDVQRLLRLLEEPSPLFGDSTKEARDGLLLETLASAFRDCIARMGRDTEAWAWAWLHTLQLEHPASERLRAAGFSPDVGPIPLGGSDSTVMKAAYRPSDFRIVSGAAVRLVMDVGDWDRSLWIASPGQSGDPRSPHYADLAPLWARGEHVPMVYSAAAVDDVTVERIALTPR
jgi:penicillin G amidase